jgi:hypothetical protein
MKQLFTLIFLFSLLSGFSLDGGTAAPDHAVWSSILQRFVTSEGKVDYNGIKGDRRFPDYLLTLSASHPDDSWSNEEKMAFWINTYNAFTVKLITQNMPLKSIKDIETPWDRKFISIEGKTYSLNDIENKVLRAEFKDARIHFAVNCASKSCPTLQNRAYTPGNLESMLESSTRAFINDPKMNNLTTNKIQISNLFEWYMGDFTMKGTLVQFLNRYAQVSIAPGAAVTYMEYDWTLNN